MIPYQIKKIIVPIDLSEASLNAVNTAMIIAKKHVAEICLLNIIEPAFDPFLNEINSGLSTTSANSSAVLTALAGTIQHETNFKPKIIQEEGCVAEKIIKNSRIQQSDLIVMGSHGASGFRNGFLGSNTYTVIKQAHCPVLSVPSKKKYQSFQKIIFPVRPVSGALKLYDVVCHFLSAESSMDVLGLSYTKIDRDTHVLDKIVGEIKDKLEMDKVKANVMWAAGHTVADDVLQHVQQHFADLIIVSSALDITTKTNFIGPHTQKIINCAKVPVLCIKN